MPLCLVVFIVCLPPPLPCAILGATWLLFLCRSWRYLPHASFLHFPSSALCALLTRLSHINSCSCFGLRRIWDAHILLSYKYDKSAMREYASNCPLKSPKNGCFFVRAEKKFCTRTKSISFVKQIFFLREEKLNSSRNGIF